MNLMMQTGINQVKDQAEKSIQSEMPLLPNEDNNKNQLKEPNIAVNNNAKQKKKKLKKKLIIDKGLSIRMYTILFIHTLLLTLLLFYFNYDSDNIIYEKANELGNYTWIIFGGCLLLSIILSFLVSKVKLISTVFLNYIFYIIILALNGAAVVWGGKGESFDYIISMLIMFDSASLVILIFLALMKDAAPSTFWLMCSCAAGSLLAMYALIKIYSNHKYFVLVICILSFAIYETMNYSAFDSYTNKNKNTNNLRPSMIALPFELNLSFIEFIFYILYGIFSFFKSCCCSK